MATGLLALLDDVAAIAKVAAASLDDVVAQAARAGVKSAGLVIDDTAVTPRYVVGLAPAREIPIIWKIARGSIKNKLVILLPLALLLSLFAPWLITPLLMIGGAYLCYEGAEKVFEALFPHAAHEHEHEVEREPRNPRELEDRRVTSAIRTDFILSAEIMFLALSTIPDLGFWAQGAVLALVGVGITALVYGAVALLVKADDVGVALASNGSSSALGAFARPLGRALVGFMPILFKVLTVVGTAAMLWVGGGILVHGLAVLGVHGPEHVIHALAEAASNSVPFATSFVGWLAGAGVAGLLGMVAGSVLIPVVGKVLAPLLRALAGLWR